MTLIVIALLVRAARARFRPSGAVRRAALVLLAVSASACSPGYQYLSVVSDGPEGWPARPAGIVPIEEALSGCSSGQPIGPSVQFACPDAQEVHVVRVRGESGDDACRRFVAEMYRADERAGLSLAGGLPAYANASGGSEGGLVAACAPHPVRGMLVAMVGGAPLDTAFVVRTLPAVLREPLPDRLAGPRRPDSLAFFGRWLPVDPVCKPRGVQNLSCFPYGQMDWQAYSSLERAEQALDARVHHTAAERGGKVLADETVACVFEGVVATCRQVTYRLPVSKLLTLGRSNVLIANYVAQTVRGRHALAVCSYYDDQGSTTQPAPLCREAFVLDGEAREDEG